MTGDIEPEGSTKRCSPFPFLQKKGGAKKIFEMLPCFVQLSGSGHILCQGEYAERNDTMKEKEKNVRYGDVDDMIFVDEWFASER